MPFLSGSGLVELGLGQVQGQERSTLHEFEIRAR
jgi:hypothetical protein